MACLLSALLRRGAGLDATAPAGAGHAVGRHRRRPWSSCASRVEQLEARLAYARAHRPPSGMTTVASPSAVVLLTRRLRVRRTSTRAAPSVRGVGRHRHRSLTPTVHPLRPHHRRAHLLVGFRWSRGRGRVQPLLVAARPVTGAATACAEPGCPNVATERGRCRLPTGAGDRRPARAATAPSTSASGRASLAAHPTCACGAPATTVHHTRHDAGAAGGLDERYWQPACLACNSSEAARWRPPPRARFPDPGDCRRAPPRGASGIPGWPRTPWSPARPDRGL